MLCFADFELDGGAYQLRRAGRAVHLERRPLDLLFLLAERRGQLVTRDEMVERIWKGVFLDSDTRINVGSRKIRQALGDDAEAPRFVVTVPAKGYRFIADVCEESLAASNQLAGRGIYYPTGQVPSQLPAEKPGAQQEQPRGDTLAPAGRLWGRFIGRAEEIAALRTAIDAAFGGQAPLVMLVGEPGIGKTRLAEEAGIYARQRGPHVLVGHCYEGEAASPYSPFVEAIREYLSTRPDDALKAELDNKAPDLAKLVPEIRECIPDLPLRRPPIQRTSGCACSTASHRSWSTRRRPTPSCCTSRTCTGPTRRRCCLHVFDFNQRAISCYGKCGFRREGVLRDYWYKTANSATRL